jgi:single-stranded-DNA-specific exonuclease
MAMPLDMINYDFIEDISKLEPFGNANPKPLFGFKGMDLAKAVILGNKRNVVKFNINNQLQGQMEAIMFCDGDKWMEEVGLHYGTQEREKLTSGTTNEVKMDIVYYPAINEYMGRTSIQIVINNYRFDRSRPRG